MSRLSEAVERAKDQITPARDWGTIPAELISAAPMAGEVSA